MEVDRSQMASSTLQISTEVIAKMARLAALEVSEIAEVSTGNGPQKYLGKAKLQRPVTVEMKDGIAQVTIQLMVKDDCAVRAVCQKVQENVKTTIQNMTGITVSKVNVVVVGLKEDAVEE